MKEIAETSYERTKDSKGYYIFNVMVEEKNPPMYPAKIYLRKDLFKNKPNIIQIVVKEGKLK